MDCQYDHQYYKPRTTLNKRVHLEGTRKMGYKAHIIQWQYILYPEFVIPSSCSYESMRQERLAKEEKVHQLRDHLNSQKPVKTKSIYYVSLPTEEAHHSTHPTRGANMMLKELIHT